MLDPKIVLENAMRCWARWRDPGDLMYRDRAIGLFGTCLGLLK
jgi:hypothetical protein